MSTATLKAGTLQQALDMYISSAKRQQNATNVLPVVKAAIGQEMQLVIAARSALAGVTADADLTITDGTSIVSSRNKG